MLTETKKIQLSVTLDAELVDKIDRLADNREKAISEGLQLWIAKEIEDQLRKFYQNRPQSDIDFEEAWAEFAQEQMEEIFYEEGL